MPRIFTRNPGFLLLFGFLELFSCIDPAHGLPPRTPVTVCVYENPPLLFRASSGQVDGLFADLLEAIAEREKWRLNYVDGTWEECMDRLEAESVDLLPAIAYTEERSRRFVFNRETILTNYGVVYVRTSSGIESLLDLAEKTVAVLSRDIYYDGLRRMARDFHLSCRFVECDSYSEVLGAMEKGDADAGLLNRLHGQKARVPAGVVRSPIVLAPTEVRFAGAGRCGHLLAAIDAQLGKLKGADNSLLHASIDKWLMVKPSTVRPRWFRAMMILIVLTGIFSGIYVLFLKWQMQKQIRESENLFRAAFLNHPDAVNINRFSDGLYIDTNNGFTELTGYTREEVIGKNSLELDIWDDSADRRQLVEKLRTQGYVTNFEAGFRLKNREVITGLMSASLIERNGDVHILSVTRNIEDRKQTEEKYRTLFDSSPEGIAVTDLNGHFIEVNRAFQALVGYDGDELRRMNIRDITPGEFRKAEAERIKRLGAGVRTEAPFEKVFVRKDGVRIPVALRGWMIRDSRSRPVLMGAFVKDIRGERELARQKAELEHQLRLNQKMEAIGTLAGGIAHDFNNILSGILGFSELLKEDVPAEHLLWHSYIDQLRAAGLRARDLVRQILEFSREGGGEFHPVRLQMLVREVLRLIRATLPQSIAVKTCFSDGGTPVMADATQIHQVIMNLCTNAHHAMSGAEKGQLTAETEKVAFDHEQKLSHGNLKPGSYLKLSISDTGAGIPRENLSRIFDPYFTTRARGEGTGLGLSVSRGIVQHHGGAIHVESVLNQGTAFTVFLPLSRNSETPVAAPADEAPLPRGSEGILFVDDESVFVDIVRRMLESLGYTVTASESAPDALKIFAASPQNFDLVMTDQTMPQLTGLEFSQAVKKIRTDIPIILCTGFSENLDRAALERAGIKALLMKPVSKRELAHALREALDP